MPPHQIILDRAADAAIGQGHGIGAGRFDESGIDIDFTEVIDQHTKAHPIGLSKQAAEQGGLAGAQKAAQHGGGNGW